MTAVVVLSGGMDSAAAAWWARRRFGEVVCMSADYGQRHVKELAHAATLAGMLGAEHVVVDITAAFRAVAAPGPLTDHAAPLPEGHYAAESMRATVVPNRNAVLVSLAVSVAAARGVGHVVVGVHSGDHYIYPDCRPAFIDAMRLAVQAATEGAVALHAPWLEATKAGIVRAGEALGVPWASTWSCYAGGAVHCGRCGTCVERREAFDLAGVLDPTKYEKVTP